jgi:DNA replicative helicase MCM subunit Mcm2 (Cdc46/Mcm family)
VSACGCCLRFDLIYLLLDKADQTRDRKLAHHLVSVTAHIETPSTVWVTCHQEVCLSKLQSVLDLYRSRE